MRKPLPTRKQPPGTRKADTKFARAEDVAEDVKAQPELSAATLTVLGYPPEMRPYIVAA